MGEHKVRPTFLACAKRFMLPGWYQALMRETVPSQACKHRNAAGLTGPCSPPKERLFDFK